MWCPSHQRPQHGAGQKWGSVDEQWAIQKGCGLGLLKAWQRLTRIYRNLPLDFQEWSSLQPPWNKFIVRSKHSPWWVQRVSRYVWRWSRERERTVIPQWCMNEIKSHNLHFHLKQLPHFESRGMGLSRTNDFRLTPNFVGEQSIRKSHRVNRVTHSSRKLLKPAYHWLGKSCPRMTIAEPTEYGIHSHYTQYKDRYRNRMKSM